MASFYLHVAAQQRRELTRTRIFGPLRPARRARPSPAATVVLAAASSKDPYDLLGLDRRTATVDKIKRAFRKRALRLHPDVNKAPDARERFMEAKAAYRQLLEAAEAREQRASAGPSGWGGGTSAAGSRPSGGGYGRAAPRQRQQEEEFYGLEDLLRDIDKEINDFATRRRAAKMAKATVGGTDAAAAAEPSSLWDELLDIGEEFVEFLEQGLATDADEQAAYNSYRGATRRAAPCSESSGNSSGSSRAARGSTGSSNSSGSTPPPPPPPPPPSAAEAVEAELQALKRKLGKL